MQQEPTTTIALGIEDLESLEAPSYATGVAGILVGIGVGILIVTLT